ncbi:hypothetical protein DPMN_139721 [Dreissena polymorpha]|uniref:Uncharacterized protein n=1 Tax=Dreissena polymorpha TaxID=45954 RepID=A0A9D4JFY1_DREPO|nr:hypothetical protein DPMN_139721 [Dreissena polymorpha]
MKLLCLPKLPAEHIVPVFETLVDLATEHIMRSWSTCVELGSSRMCGPCTVGLCTDALSVQTTMSKVNINVNYFMVND